MAVSQMESRRYEFILRAESPIAHHEGTFGNSAVAMRRKVRLPDGGWSHVPIVTADTMRHGLREAGAYALLDAAGLLGAESLGEAALRLLFAGGMVTGRGDASTVKLDGYREMVELVPVLALLGGCADNRVIPGRLHVGDAVLVSEESAHLIPSWVLEEIRADGAALDMARAHIEVVQRVRMDPTLDPGKRKLLTSAASGGVERRLLASEAAHNEDNAVAREASKSSMMPRTYETIAAGSLFYWQVTATCYSDLDVDTFHTMLAAFLSDAKVGGKKGTGCGLLRAVKAKQVGILRPSERTTALDPGALAPKVGETFRQHVAARAERVKEYLSRVDA
jgi:hypothetical protein